MFDKRLLALVPHVKKYIFANVALQWGALVATIVLMFAVGYCVRSLVEGALSGDAAIHVDQVALCIGVALVALALRVVFSAAAQRMGARASSEAKQAIRRVLYDKLVSLGPSYVEHMATSEAVQISVEGTEQLESYFGAYVPQFFYALIAPVTLFVCLAPLSFSAALVLLVCVPLIPLSIVVIQKIAKRIMRSYWGSYTDLGAAFLDNVQGLTTLKVYQADQMRHDAMNREAESFRQATMRLLRMQLNSVTVMDLFAFGGAAIGIIVVMQQFAASDISFAAAFTVIFLSAEFFLPMRMLGSLFHTAMNGMAAADTMFKVLEIAEPAEGARAVDMSADGFTCEGISYSYDGERRVLSHVSLRAEPGSFIGIVGESGSGKSTLASILSGAITGYEGSLRIGGVDAREASRSSCARSITTVSCTSYVFKGTVRSNLLLANPQATEAELWESLCACRLDGFVRAHGGLDMPIAERGSNLSGGQRQRLSLARALLHDSPAYIFDEATSNVDAESEQAILDVIGKLAHMKTVIVISHRLSSLKAADCLYVIDDGRLVESGTHEALLEAHGVYAALWNQQSELESFAASEHVASSMCACLSDDDCDQSDLASAPCEPRASQRSALSIMGRLTKLVLPLALPMACAVLLGVAGFLAAIFLTVFGVLGVLSAVANIADITLVAAIACVAVCGVVRGPLHYGEQMCNHFIAFKLLASIRDRVFKALRSLAPAKLEGRDKGNLVSLVTSDIELLEVFYAHTISPVCIALIVSAIMVVCTGFVHPVLGAVSAFSYVLIGIAVPFAAARAQKDGERILRDEIGDMNSFVLDSLRGLSETLQYGGQQRRAEELDRRMEHLSRVSYRCKAVSALSSSLTNALIVVCDIVMLLVSLGLYHLGLIDVSGMVVALAFLMSSFGPVVAVANLGSSLQQTIASGARVLDLLDEKPQVVEVADGVELAEFDGAELRGVSFGYNDDTVVRDIDIAIPRGSVVRLAGKSGSGKSTLCKLLMRFWDPATGEVLLSREDLRFVSTASLRECESFMTQDTHLFAGTIGDNIRIANPRATDDEVLRACEQASLAETIARFPRGLNTDVGELGDALSGGERQRLGLARVFLHDAPFVLLDEPTSNLDSLNEACVLRALARVKRDKTMVIVTHRDSAACLADVTYCIERGRVS